VRSKRAVRRQSGREGSVFAYGHPLATRVIAKARPLLRRSCNALRAASIGLNAMVQFAIQYGKLKMNVKVPTEMVILALLMLVR
jgi:hypothetical protein